MSSADNRVEAAISEASAWLVRLRDPSCTPDLRQAFARWLERDANHRVEFARIEQTWRDVGTISEEVADLAQARARLAAHRQVIAKGRGGASIRRNFGGWMKASVAVASIVAVAYAGNAWMAANVASFAATYSTAVGETRRIRLEDGSRIEINTDSRMTVALYRTHREVVLERGEGWFEVSPDKARPFRVAAGNATVEVVGTRFSVRNPPQGLDVAVEEGKVRVFRTDDPANSVMLSQGQGVQLAAADSPLHPAAVDVEQRSAWRTGRLILSGRPLGEVAAELSRYRSIPIRITPDAASLPVTAVINLHSADEWLSALPITLPIRSSRDANGGWSIESASAASPDLLLNAPRRIAN